MKKIFYQKYGWLALLVLLIAVNFIAAKFHYLADLTKEKRYTLSNATRQTIQQLQEPVYIDVFLKGDFPAGFKKLSNSTLEFLQLLKDVNSSKIIYRFITPEEDIPGTTKKYADSLQALGASPINLSVQIKGGQKQQMIYPVALAKYKDRFSLIELYSGAKRIITQDEINNAEATMEYQFVKTIDELSSEKKPVIAYATGNGEPTGPETFDFRQAVQQRYRLNTFDLSQQKFISPDIDVLIITKPTIQFTDEEKLKLDQYVMHGGKIIFLVDALVAEQDSLQFKPETIAYDRNLNLADLLFRYGVRINPDLVMDLQCDFLPFRVGGSNENPQFEFLRWNYYPVFQSRSTHIINRNLGLVCSRFVNSIDTVSAENVKKTILLSSSPNSRIISTPALISLNENKITPEDSKFKSDNIPVAVLLEGKFTSLYRNRLGVAAKDSLQKLGLPFKESSEENSKIIVVADGDIMLNDFTQATGPLYMGWNKYTYQAYQNGDEAGKYFIPYANRNFILNCLEYFTNKPGIIETGNKQIILRMLDPKKINLQRSLWLLVNIALPVLLIILFGLAYQRIRKNRYSR
ncbi:MAG: gliding motility-associated ABC transporter substrate-binding protein GldG [Chitinophagaceae bacterium]